MKTMVKWMAFMAIFMVAVQAFITEFVPQYEKWKEKYPSEPEEDEEDEEAALPEGVERNTAENLFGKESGKEATDGMGS